MRGSTTDIGSPSRGAAPRYSSATRASCSSSWLGAASRTTPESMTAPVMGDREPGARVLLDQQHRAPAVVERADGLEHDVPRLRVEPHRRLVHQDHLRLEHQRARDLDELLLAARERAGVVATALADQREALGQRLGALAHEPLVAQRRARRSGGCPRRSSAGRGCAPAARARRRARAPRAPSDP